jgi:two-component system sensor histidine kinase BaeS
MSLRRRLWLGIAVSVVASVLIAIVVGALLVRTQLESNQAAELSRQADLIAQQGLPGPAERSALAAQGTRLVLMRAAEAQTVLPASAASSLTDRGQAQGTAQIDGDRVLFAAHTDGPGVVVLVHSTTLPASAWRPFLRILFLVALIGVGVAAFASWLMARQITAPLGRVVEATGRLAADTEPAPLPVEGPRELAALATSFNTMVDRLGVARAAERSFLLSVSHELKTPLTAVRGYAEGLVDGAVDPTDAGTVIGREAARLERLVRDLLDLARLNQRTFSIEPVAIDLAGAAADVTSAYAERARERGIELTHRVDPAGAGPVMADPDRLAQVLSNLVENALECTPRDGSVTVLVSAAEVRVTDTGPGIEPADLSHAFDRFHLHDRYARDRRMGTGLGLALVQELTRRMDGSVAVESTIGQGSTFTVRLRPAPPDRPVA